MSSGKRIAKRSIVGTRVCVPVNGVPVAGSTLYLPAVIHSTRVLGLETSYCVFFAINDCPAELMSILPHRKEYRAEQIIGPGFQSVTSVRRFAAGQRVFITFKGREVSGIVTRHEPHADEVTLTIDTVSKNKDSLLESNADAVQVQVRRKVEEIRLLESRKSARLVDSDTDYSRFLQSESETTSEAQQANTATQVQTANTCWSSSGETTSVMSSSLPTTASDRKNINISSSNNSPQLLPQHHEQQQRQTVQGRKRVASDSTEDLIMDDCSAAMVLMSLSCSPKSPLFFSLNHNNNISANSNTTNNNSSSDKTSKYSHSWTSGTSADSGFVFDSPQSGLRRKGCGSSRSTTPSPPTAKDRAAAAQQVTGDEGIELETEQEVALSESDTSGGMSLMKSKFKRVILFKCTWPGCESEYRQNPAIERHVRQQHSVEAGEEIFYYTEIEGVSRAVGTAYQRHNLLDGRQSDDHRKLYSPVVAGNDGSNSSSSSGPQSPSNGIVGNINTPVFAFTASAPTWSHLDMARPAHEDPEYQRQVQRSQQQRSGPITIPGMSFTHHSAFVSSPKSQGNNKLIKLDANGVLKVSPVSLLQSSASACSPKQRSGRSRGDSRKCRKVYGMESRDQWCTQCKWKKACTRFHD